MCSFFVKEPHCFILRGWINLIMPERPHYCGLPPSHCSVVSFSCSGPNTLLYYRITGAVELLFVVVKERETFPGCFLEKKVQFGRSLTWLPGSLLQVSLRKKQEDVTWKRPAGVLFMLVTAGCQCCPRGHCTEELESQCCVEKCIMVQDLSGLQDGSCAIKN